MTQRKPYTDDQGRIPLILAAKRGKLNDEKGQICRCCEYCDAELVTTAADVERFTKAAHNQGANGIFFVCSPCYQKRMHRSSPSVEEPLDESEATYTFSPADRRRMRVIARFLDELAEHPTLHGTEKLCEAFGIRVLPPPGPHVTRDALRNMATFLRDAQSGDE